MNAITKSHVDYAHLPDVSELVDIHNSYYGTKRRAEDWIWQYENFEPNKAVFTMVRHNGTLIGTQAMMPVYMKVGNKIVLTGKSENTLLRPEYRGQKIMEDLYEYAVELCKDRGFEFIWGFTGAARAFQKFGFSVYPLPQTLWRPGFNMGVGLASRFRMPNPFWRKIAVMGKYGLNYLKNIGSLTLPGVAKKAEYQISIGRIDIPQLSGLHDRLRASYPGLISLHLDERYIDWRIRKHPFLKYREYQVLKNEALQAYAFVVNANGVVSISDMASIDDYASHVLVRQIVLDFQKRTGQFDVFINPRCISARNLVEAMKHFGFQPGEISNLVVRDLSAGKHREIENLDQWFITGLWTEGYSM